MFEFAGRQYELKYNLKRVEMIEDATGVPTLANMQRTGMRISQLKVYLGYGLKEAGSDAFVAPKKALDLAEQMIEEMGFANATSLVIEALQRDCPFFFRAD